MALLVGIVLVRDVAAVNEVVAIEVVEVSVLGLVMGMKAKTVLPIGSVWLMTRSRRSASEASLPSISPA